MYRERSVAVVIPAYNEEKLISETLKGIPDFVDKIYVIDDGSTDKTSEIVEDFMRIDKRVMLIKHEKNLGVGKAIVDGYKKAIEDNIDLIAVMAGDNQMDPRYLPSLLDPLVDGVADYSKGNRLVSKDYIKGMSRWRLFGNTILTLLTKIASGYWHIYDPQNGYTAVRRDALKNLPLDEVYPWYGYCNDLLVKMNVFGLKVIDVPIPARYGKEKSKIKYGKYIMKVSVLLLRNFFWRLKVKYVLKNFHPLVFFYLFGIIMTILGVLGGIWSIAMKFIAGERLFERAVISLLLFGIGAQFIFFAMYFDMEENRTIHRNYKGG